MYTVLGGRRAQECPTTNRVNKLLASSFRGVGSLCPDQIVQRLGKAASGPPAEFLPTVAATLLLTNAPQKMWGPGHCCCPTEIGELPSLNRKGWRSWTSDMQNPISFASSTSSHPHTCSNKVQASRFHVLQGSAALRQSTDGISLPDRYRWGSSRRTSEPACKIHKRHRRPLNMWC